MVIGPWASQAIAFRLLYAICQDMKPDPSLLHERLDEMWTTFKARNQDLIDELQRHFVDDRRGQDDRPKIFVAFALGRVVLIATRYGDQVRAKLFWEDAPRRYVLAARRLGVACVAGFHTRREQRDTHLSREPSAFLP